MKLSHSPKTGLYSRMAIIAALVGSAACAGKQEASQAPSSCVLQRRQPAPDEAPESDKAMQNAEEARKSILRSTGAAQSLLDVLMEGNSDEAAEEEDNEEDAEPDPDQ